MSRERSSLIHLRETTREGIFSIFSQSFRISIFVYLEFLFRTRMTFERQCGMLSNILKVEKTEHFLFFICKKNKAWCTGFFDRWLLRLHTDAMQQWSSWWSLLANNQKLLRGNEWYVTLPYISFLCWLIPWNEY